MDQKTILEKLDEKYQSLGENPETYLKGLLHSKPVCYWDYIEVETLNSLQKPKTNFKDEEIFIMYHQVTELFFKMMIHELKQLVFEDLPENGVLNKLNRLIRYSEFLVSSFDVMKYGMNYEDYNQFRSALTPASGFQSFQFRAIELYSTRIKNLQTYFTAGVKEVRAWTVPVGATAPQAAGVIHTDFEKGFIRAEVMKYEDFTTLGSEAAVKEAGKFKVEGKEYIVQDGDIMHFRFNV